MAASLFHLCAYIWTMGGEIDVEVVKKKKALT